MGDLVIGFLLACGSFLCPDGLNSQDVGINVTAYCGSEAWMNQADVQAFLQDHGDFSQVSRDNQIRIHIHTQRNAIHYRTVADYYDHFGCGDNIIIAEDLQDRSAR